MHTLIYRIGLACEICTIILLGDRWVTDVLAKAGFNRVKSTKLPLSSPKVKVEHPPLGHRDSLAVSLQCEYLLIHVGGGAGVTESKMWAKLELVRDLSWRIWKDAG
jgi:hypothetical protein